MARLIDVSCGSRAGPNGEAVGFDGGDWREVAECVLFTIAGREEVHPEDLVERGVLVRPR